MIKVISAVCLTILAFGISIFLYVTNTTIDETLYGTREVVLFIIPFTLVAVNSNLFILPKLLNKHNSYSRFKNGMESIFLSLSIILLILHCGIIFVTTGTEINLLLIIPVSVGIVLITTANTLPRFLIEMKDSSTPFNKSTNQMWNIVIRPFSLPLFIGGTVMLFCVLLPADLMLVGFFTILFGTLLISILRSYRAYQIQTNK